MACNRSFLVYISICTSGTGARAGVAASKSPWKGGIGEPLFLVKAFGRLLTSLLATRLAERFCQREKSGAISTAWPAPESWLKLF